MGLNTVNMNFRLKDSGLYAYMPSILKIRLNFATLQILLKILTCLGRISHYRRISPLSGTGLQPTNQFEEMAR